MARVTPEGQFSAYTYQAKRQPLIKPLLGYNEVLFSSLPTNGKCFHLSFRIILFVISAPIFYPLFSLMALMGLPFTKKVTLILPGPEKGTSDSPAISVSTSPCNGSGKNSLRSSASNLTHKKVDTLKEWQVKLNECSQQALKPALSFDYCRQFCCLFKLTIGSGEGVCSDVLLLRPAPSAGRLIKEDCISRIQDISDILQKLDVSIWEKRPVVLSAVLMVEKEDRSCQWIDFTAEILVCESDRHFHSLEKADYQGIEKVESLMKQFNPSHQLILDDSGFLKKQS